jgi:predicted CXXCH cytochrome family protein
MEYYEIVSQACGGTHCDVGVPEPRRSHFMKSGRMLQFRQMKRFRSVIVIFALVMSAGFLFFPQYKHWQNDPQATTTPDEYVDPAQCASCHPTIYETFQHTGMGRSFSRMRPANSIEDFKNKNTLYHRLSDRYYTIYERDGRYFQRRHQSGPNGEPINIVEKEIHYVLGSGNHSRAYLHLNEQKKLIQLPIAWYSENGGYWDMNPGYDRPDHLDFQRTISLECMFCHNGYPEIPEYSDRSGNDAALQGRIPEGIDCQRCHGPGGAHIRATAAANSTVETIRQAIVNPARLSSDRNLEVCMQCHLESTSTRLPYSVRRFDRGVFSYRPGEPLADYAIHFDHAPGSERNDKFEIVNQAYRLRQSACFLRSGGAMNCTTCHDPHNVPRAEEAARHYVSVCQSCHEDRVGSLTAAGQHPSAVDCVFCHMPRRRTDDVVHVVMTDHYIQRTRQSGDLLAPITEEAAGTNKNDYKGEVALYYPPNLPPTADNELYVAVAQVIQSSNLEAGIPLLRTAIEKHRPAEGEFYFVLADAYRNVNALQLAVPMYQEALERRPDFWPALHGLGLSLASVGQLERAVEFLEGARNLSTNENVANDLAMVYRGMGRLSEAVVALKNALFLNPDFPQTHNNLGRILAQTGDIGGAEEAFTQAIRLQPDSPGPYTNLASVLVGRGDLERAQYYLERAVAQALPMNPALANARSLLGDVMTMRGQRERALVHYQEALRIDPNLAPARFGLGSVLASLGRNAEAIVQFQKVAETGDIDFRRAALAAMQKLRQ